MSIQEKLKQAGLPTTNLRPLFEEDDGVYLLDTPGVDAISLWKRLSAGAGETGHWPIILGPPQTLSDVKDRLEYNEASPAAILEASKQLDPQKWFQKRLEMDPEAYEMEEGEWPEGAESNNSIASVSDIVSRRIHPQVTIALVPTALSWEAFAYLRFGAWNECPEPFEHVALWRRWNEIYGAEVCAVTTDVVEAFVLRPPESREDALKLATEQFTYCSDIVAQGTNTIEALAAGLLSGRTWFFWWD